MKSVSCVQFSVWLNTFDSKKLLVTFGQVEDMKSIVIYFSKVNSAINPPLACLEHQVGVVHEGAGVLVLGDADQDDQAQGDVVGGSLGLVVLGSKLRHYVTVQCIIKVLVAHTQRRPSR